MLAGRNSLMRRILRFTPLDIHAPDGFGQESRLSRFYMAYRTHQRISSESILGYPIRLSQMRRKKRLEMPNIAHSAEFPDALDMLDAWEKPRIPYVSIKMH